MGRAERRLAHQELGLITVQRAELDIDRDFTAPSVFHSEIVDAAVFGREMGGRSFVTSTQSDRGLPAGADDAPPVRREKINRNCCAPPPPKYRLLPPGSLVSVGTRILCRLR